MNSPKKWQRISDTDYRFLRLLFSTIFDVYSVCTEKCTKMIETRIFNQLERVTDSELVIIWEFWHLSFAILPDLTTPV